MFCKNCGKEISNEAYVCIHCGVLKGKGISYCSNCGASLDPNFKNCKYCSTPIKETTTTNKKSKLAAGIFGIIFGGLGIHRFYLGYTTIGIIQVILTFLTCGISSIWGMIEGILILCDSTITTDADGNELE